MKIVYTKGKIYLEKGVFAEAMLVEGDRILATGTDAELCPKADKVVDLGGKTVIPGLNDSHLHLYYTGHAMTQVDLNSATSIDEVVEMGKAFIKEHGITKDGILVGRGWNQDYFTSGERRMLERKDLDRISTEIPIIMERVCVHVCTLNSKALEILNIPEGKEIPGGEIRKDEKGEYNGIFTENALQYAKSIIPDETAENVKKKFEMAMEHAYSCGLTSVQSCDVMDKNYRLYIKVLDEMYENGEGKLRYYPQFLCGSIEEIKAYEKEYYRQDKYNDVYQRGAWKLFKDGSLGGRTALMRKPYNDDPDTVGVAALSDELLDEIMAYAEEKGIRVVVHAIGDGAVQSLIDAYSKHMKPGNPLRHGIVHNQITDLEQLKAIAKHKITVMYQPIFLQYDIMIIEDRVGKELASTSYAFKTMYDLDNDLTSFGTDSPVEDLNPFPCIYCAVTRKRLNGEPEGGFYPNERMTVEEAVDNYTLGSAYSQGMEDRLGRLKEGYYADFVILDKDIFTIDPEEIKDIKPLATYIGGEKVWER